MAGRMGNKRKTVQNLRIQRIDADRNLIFVRGAVPGNSGRPVRVRSAVRKILENRRDPAELAAEVNEVELANPIGLPSATEAEPSAIGLAGALVAGPAPQPSA